MTTSQISPVAVWPYVFVGGLVKIICGGLAYCYFATTGREANIGSTPITILAVALSLSWYSYRINRPMLRRELVKFASGIALVDLLLSLTIMIVTIWLAGEQISVRNIGLVLDGNKTNLKSDDLIPILFVFSFAALMVFAISLFFA